MRVKHLTGITLLTLLTGVIFMPVNGLAWEPPREVSLQEVQATTDKVMAMPVLPITTREDIFRIDAVGLNWDIVVMVYEPRDETLIPQSPDGKKLGIFLLHGGTGDWRSLDQAARIASERFGYRVVSLTFPGRLNLDDPSRDWPRDTVNPGCWGTGYIHGATRTKIFPMASHRWSFIYGTRPYGKDISLRKF